MIYDTKAKLLTPLEERELFQRYERGDLKAKERLVESNLGLVVREARKRFNNHFTIEDMAQEGTIGLIRAIEKFDWRRGLKLSTYAVPWIQHEIQRSIDNKGRDVRLPAHDALTGHQMKKYVDKIRKTEGRTPDEEEIKKKFKLEDWRYEYINRWLPGTLPSLEKKVSGTNNTELGDLIPNETAEDPEEIVTNTDARKYIRERVSELDTEERTIITLRFGLDGDEPLSTSAVGETLGWSYDKVKRIEDSVLLRWRFDEGIRTTKKMPAPRGTTCKRGHIIHGDNEAADGSCLACKAYKPYVPGKTCKKGHPYNEKNTSYRAGTGHAQCNICRRERDRRRYARRS